MEYIRVDPHPDLKKYIVCYWMMRSDDTLPTIEKIIPDGYPELIFNYRDAYRAKISRDWKLQTPHMLAGQLTTFFYLENTGATGSVAVKFQPAALTQLFNLNMIEYLDTILELEKLEHPQLQSYQEMVTALLTHGKITNDELVKNALDNFFTRLAPNAFPNPLDQTLAQLFNEHGDVSVAALASTARISERQLERLFKKYIGLSPKYYARIIKFNHIFKVIKAGEMSWTEVVYASGYYDQSHFIRNFKAFTGEDPSSYFFEQKNMANFFLNK